jgi:tetratricopeptide (TPR) repeat protein
MGLPRLPINDLQFAPTLEKDLLAATDIGLFYCDLTQPQPQWSNVNQDLPNCVITDIEFDVFHNEIYISTFGRGYWKSAMSCAPMADLHITANSQITIPTLANHSIVVEPGVVFTVTSTLSFVENARLIVEPGGKLIVNGGTLTNGCSNAFWEGVEVRGHSNLSQTPANQGVVELKNNARINHAKCGIRTAEVLIGEDTWEYNWNSTGGIIKAENSMFLNNIKDVEFLSYSNLQTSNGQTEEENNVSYFSGCRFLVDEELFGISSLNCRVSLFEVDGVKFVSSEFEIAQTSPYSQSNAGSGIYSLASSPIVRSTCICTPNSFNEGNPSDITAQTLFTTSSDYTHPSLFRNFKYGIRLSGDGGIQNPVIRNSVFQDNQYGIWVGAQNATTIYRNKFKISDVPGLDQCAGVFLGKCNHYNVSRNVFMGEVNSHFNSVGVYVKDSPENANEIYLNDFDQLEYGIIAEGDQAENSPVLGGLQLLCGKYSNITWSNSVVPHSGESFAEIAIDQGHQTYPQVTSSSDLAGNLFANASTSATPFSDYFNCMGCNIIKYHAHDSNSNSAVVPVNITGNVLVDENNIPFTSRWNACPVEHALLPEKSLLVELVELNDSIINVEKAQYYQLIDGGQTGAVVSFISNLANSSALIRENLLPLCPYLSVTALDTLLDRSASMNPWHLSELLIACSPIDPVLLKRINDEVALPNYFLGLINEYQDGGNERLQKETMLKAANINKNRAFGKLMELEVSSDSIARNYSELEALFETNNDISESSMLYEIYRAQGKFEEASSVYEAYLRDTLSADENALNDIIFDLSNNGGYAFADSSQQQALQSLLNSEESIRMQVKSALELMTKEPFECDFIYPEIPKSKNNEITEKPIKISLLEVYPNPVSDDFSVGFVLPADQRNSMLNVYNDLGQLIEQVDLSKDNGIHYLNARNWQSGLYILDLIANGKVVESKSIVVKH